MLSLVLCMSLCGCAVFSSNESQDSSEQTSSAVSEPSEQTGDKNAINLSPEQYTALNTKSLRDLRDSAKNTTKENTGLSEKYFAAPLSDDNTHSIVHTYGKYKSNEQNYDAEMQFSDGCKYYKMTLYNGTDSSFDGYIYKDKKIYWFRDNRKEYVDVTDHEDEYVFGLPDYSSGEIGDPSECGECVYDGKQMKYELFLVSTRAIVTYFYNDKAYMLETYIDDTTDSSEVGDVTPENADLSKYILISYTKPETGLSVDPSLYELPKEYKEITLDELSRELFSSADSE